MNYKVIEDGYYSHIVKTEEPANGYEVYKTYTEAKNDLADTLTEYIKEYKLCLKKLRSQKKDQVELDY